MVKKYIVRLSQDEHKILNSLVNKGKVAAYKRKHAQILLKADIGKFGPGWTDLQISKAFDITTRTIESLRRQLIEKGLDGAINRAKGSGKNRTKINGDQEARLVALTCSEPPDGQSRWSLRLLADKMIELNYIDEVSHETVRQTLKKMK